MALKYRIVKGILSVAGGVALLAAVFSPFVNIAPSGSTVMTQSKSEPTQVEILYSKCGHTEISENNTLPADENGRVVIDNYCRHHYLVKAQNGKLDVYLLSDLNSQPLRSEDINIKKLPVADQNALVSGIEAHSDERLEALMEDYLS